MSLVRQVHQEIKQDPRSFPQEISRLCGCFKPDSRKTIHHFFVIDESQAWGPSARVRLSKVAGRM